MQKLKLFNPKDLFRYISARQGETKLGEKIECLSNLEGLSKSPARFVIFGIPEDIGVRANFGKPGTSNAWNAFLSAFLNVQENQYIKPQEILLLGEIDTAQEMQKAANIDESDPNYHQKLGDLVETIDILVSDLVERILSAGKIPVIIGGGHNNAFGNICGASKSFGKPINVLNIDAHTDLRKTDYRHSGNGFSYALKNGFLSKYAVFGLQQNYTPQYIFEEMKASAEISFRLFEDLPEQGKSQMLAEQLSFVNSEKFGLEVDCDAIANFPSSAISPSGFSLDEVRKMLIEVAKNNNCCYLHICEAIATPDFATGKALSYLVTDFLKNKTNA